MWERKNLYQIGSVGNEAPADSPGAPCMGSILVQNNEKILEQVNLELQVNSGENLAPRCSLILELKVSLSFLQIKSIQTLSVSSRLKKRWLRLSLNIQIPSKCPRRRLTTGTPITKEKSLSGAGQEAVPAAGECKRIA